MKICKFLFLIAAVMFLLSSCKNTTAVFMPFNDISTAPRQSLFGSTTQATEEGMLEARMEYPRMVNYTGDEEGSVPCQIFPSGIKSVFYSEDGVKEDVLLLADSAVNLQEQKLMKFYRNVVVYDHRSLDTIYTEALYWNQETRKIFSDVFVRKCSPGLVLEGEGFDSDERMENVVLRKPRGVIR